MAIDRGYTANHKFYDEMGRITPNWEWSESHRPHFEGQVARWLPVTRYERELNSWFVVSAGKATAYDRNGDLVLAGYRKAFAPGASNVLTYTSDDYNAGTIDLTTGEAYSTNGTTSYDTSDITKALRNRGLIRQSEYAMDFISQPIGFASYNYYQAAGEDVRNPTTYTYHNFKPQELLAVTCDYVGIVPLLPAKETSETMNPDNTDGADGDMETNGFGTGGWYNSNQIHAVDRYANDVAAGDDIVCYVMEYYPIAHSTDETPISVTTAGSGALTSEKDSISDVTAAGDYYIDHDVGVLFLYESGGDDVPTGWATADTITYYHYESGVSAGASRVSSYFCATGDLKEGDFVTFNADSNLVPAELDIANADGYDAGGSAYSSDPAYDSGSDAVISRQLEQAIMNYQNGIVGQVIGEMAYPRDALERVRTAYESGTSPNIYTGMTNAIMKTSGSATGGRSSQLTYSNSGEKLLIVNLIHR